MLNHRILLLLGSISLRLYACAQDDTTVSAFAGDKYLGQVSRKAGELEQQLDHQSQKILAAFFKEEKRLQRKLARKESAAAATVFSNAKEQYDTVYKKPETGRSLKQYIPSLDTLSSSLKFLGQNPQWMGMVKDGPDKLKSAMEKVKGLESGFQQAEEVKRFLSERKQYLKEQLGKLGFAKELKDLNKQAYYYSAWVNEYKSAVAVGFFELQEDPEAGSGVVQDRI